MWFCEPTVLSNKMFYVIICYINFLVYNGSSHVSKKILGNKNNKSKQKLSSFFFKFLFIQVFTDLSHSNNSYLFLFDVCRIIPHTDWSNKTFYVLINYKIQNWMSTKNWFAWYHHGWKVFKVNDLSAKIKRC